MNDVTIFGNSGFETDSLVEGPQTDALPDVRLPCLKGWLENCWMAARRWWYFSRLAPADNDDPTHLVLFAKAASNYRTIRRLHQQNDMPEGIGEFTIRAKDADRRHALAAGNYREWAWLAGQRWVMRYGESARRVVGVSMALIFLSTLLYPLAGLYNTRADARMQVVSYAAADWPDAIYVLGKSLYFSVITFTTLGYGDIQPRGWAELLATVESFAGALLMALLVFVLGRHATR